MWKFLQTDKAPEKLTQEELKEIVRFACTAAGISTESRGGISSIPSLEEVTAYVTHD